MYMHVCAYIYTHIYRDILCCPIDSFVEVAFWSEELAGLWILISHLVIWSTTLH